MSDGAPLPALRLTEDHIRRATRPVEGPLFREDWHLLEDDELDRLAAQLTVGRARPLLVFAYGSLIWKPAFDVPAQHRATAPGWHRRFSISIDHFRGTTENPGLMLALDRLLNLNYRTAWTQLVHLISGRASS